MGLLLKAYSASGTATAKIAALGSVKDFNVVQAKNLLGKACPVWDAELIASAGNKGVDARKLRQSELQGTIAQLEGDWYGYKRKIQATVAAAVIASASLPASLNDVVKPVMESIKKEPSAVLQVGSMWFVSSATYVFSCPKFDVIELVRLHFTHKNSFPFLLSLSHSQRHSATALARLLRLCKDREKCPNGKIVKNLIEYLCR